MARGSGRQSYGLTCVCMAIAGILGGETDSTRGQSYEMCARTYAGNGEAGRRAVRLVTQVAEQILTLISTIIDIPLLSVRWASANISLLPIHTMLGPLPWVVSTDLAHGRRGSAPCNTTAVICVRGRSVWLQSPHLD